MRRNFFVLLVLAAFAGGLPTTAAAHAIIVTSIPASGTAVPGPDVDVTLTYNVRVDAERSKLSLTGPDGMTSEIAITAATAEDILSGHAAGLAPGAYVLHWQVLASDGHITRGDVPFSVAPAATSP